MKGETSPATMLARRTTYNCCLFTAIDRPTPGHQQPYLDDDYLHCICSENIYFVSQFSSHCKTASHLELMNLFNRNVTK